jgi:hypothetical protein
LQMQHEHVPTERKHRALCSFLGILDLLRTHRAKSVGVEGGLEKEWRSKVSGSRGWVTEWRTFSPAPSLMFGKNGKPLPFSSTGTSLRPVCGFHFSTCTAGISFLTFFTRTAYHLHSSSIVITFVFCLSGYA